MDNELKVIIGITGILFAMLAIGYLQHYPLPVGYIRAGLGRFNQWVTGSSSDVLRCLVILAGFVVLFLNWGRY